MELPGLVHGVLAGGGVKYQQGLPVAAGQLPVDDTADLPQLVHQVLLVVQPAGGVADDDIAAPGLGRGDGVKHHGSGVGPLLVFDKGHPGPVRPDLQLLDGSGPEGIRRPQDDGLALSLQAGGQLADGGGLAHPIDADDQDDGGLGAGVEFIVPLEHFRNNGLQLPHDEAGVGDALFLDLLPQLVADVLGGIHAHVPHDQQLFQLLEKLLVNLGEGVHHLRDLPADIVPGLFQAFPDLVKDAHVFLPLLLGSVLVYVPNSAASSVRRASSLEMPWSCMVTP